MTEVVHAKSARTLLERLIRERRQTFEEFVEYAEQFARGHGESGTLSVRHLQRLVAGRQPDGSPLGPPRPATARLLERIFGERIVDLLGPADGVVHSGPETLRVAVAIVVKDANVLLVRRRPADGSGLSWQFPAGMVKPGARAEDVAVTETLGETSVHCIAVRSLGSRVHPSTSVLCEYVLCDYLAGEAMNSDAVENSGVLWAPSADLARFIPAEQVYPPVLDVLASSTLSDSQH